MQREEPGEREGKVISIERDRGIVPFDHTKLHQYVKTYCMEQVDMWRHRMGLEPFWSIEIVVSCPSAMGPHEASIWWDADCWYAQLLIGCKHLEDMLEWLIVHELCELRRWKTSSHYFEVHGFLIDGADKERLLAQFHTYRNQEIEADVYHLLGKRRPFHQSKGDQEG